MPALTMPSSVSVNSFVIGIDGIRSNRRDDLHIWRRQHVVAWNSRLQFSPRHPARAASARDGGDLLGKFSRSENIVTGCVTHDRIPFVPRVTSSWRLPRKSAEFSLSNRTAGPEVAEIRVRDFKLNLDIVRLIRLLRFHAGDFPDGKPIM